MTRETIFKEVEEKLDDAEESASDGEEPNTQSPGKNFGALARIVPVEPTPICRAVHSRAVNESDDWLSSRMSGRAVDKSLYREYPA